MNQGRFEPRQALTPSSSLAPLETNPPPQLSAHIPRQQWGNPEFSIQPATPAESEFRHSSWVIIRHRTLAAFERCGMSEQRIDRFCNCGSGSWLYKSATGDDITIRSNKCHDRWCLACQRERAGTITNALQSAMSAKTCRFLTFALRHSHTPLKAQLDRLYRSFSTLRRRKDWKEHVRGGAAFLEVKIGRDGLWHAHFHCVIEGSWWDQKEISRAWHEVTGDSSIVDVRKISDDAEAAHYVTKYVTKPAHSDVYAKPDLLDEMVVSLRGRRLCMTFGSWRGIKLEPDVHDDVEWVAVGSLDSLRSRARDGDAEAQRWIDAASRKWPLFSYLFRPPNTE